MNKTEAREKLKAVHQEHLLHNYDTLPQEYQVQLLSQIENLNLETLREQQDLLKHPSTIEIEQIDAYRDYAHNGTEEDEALGKSIISEGKVGCLLIAGGQGTRLRFDGPKGMFPVTRIKHKSLFQLFAEKTLAASKQANFPLQLAIMTSPKNDETTRSFFSSQHNFGLLPEQVSFFSQKMLPLLDIDSNLFLEDSHTIAQGPDGNGNSLKYFVESGVWQKWKDLGIEYVNFVLVDNPLGDPFDAELAGYHHRNFADATIKCIHRKDPQENVGVLVNIGGKTVVIEYTELPANEKAATTTEGFLKHRCANISSFCFSMEFVRHCADHNLPLHANFKNSKFVNEEGDSQISFEPNAWKFETFIFDTLPIATHLECLLYPRRKCFAPLKNAEGRDSLGSVQHALQESDQEIVKTISGDSPPTIPFELSQDFYYPTPYLLSVWKDRPFPKKSYITEGS